IAIVDHLPMSSAGKVDRGALSDPPPAAMEGTPPSGQLEVAMARLWRDFLGVETAVHRESDFFLLGGDSLMTVALVDRIEHRFKCVVPLQLVVESSTLASMTAAVEEIREHGSGGDPRPDPLVLIRRGRERSPLFWVPGTGGSPVSAKWVA